MKLKLHIDKIKYKEKPSENIGVIKKRLQSNNCLANVTLEEFITHIENGITYSPAVMTGTRANDWREQQIFAIDFDNNGDKFPIITSDEAIEICEANNLLPVFYYPTFNHSEDKPKFRLVFVMDKVITSLNERQTIIDTLFLLFPQCDTSCGTAEIIFFGTNKVATICDLDARISMDNILMTYSSLNKATTNSTENKPNKSYYLGFEKLIKEFDLLGYMQSRNGEYSINAKGDAKFKHCEICGHKDDLQYYADTNTFYCFSADVAKGGTIIQYLMYAEKISFLDAIKKFIWDLCDISSFEDMKPIETLVLPKFPINSLPKNLKNFVVALAEDLQVPIDMIAVTALAVASTAVQRKFEIKAKETYREPLNIFALLIAEPSERKSAIVKIMTKPIQQYEKEENRRRKSKIAEQNALLNAKRIELENYKRKGDISRIAQLLLECDELENNFVKQCRLIADDVTHEALTSLLYENDGVMSIFSPEGGIFDTLAGKYNNSYSFDTLLKAYSSDLIKVDRKGRDIEHIENSALATVQNCNQAESY